MPRLGQAGQHLFINLGCVANAGGVNGFDTATDRRSVRAHFVRDLAHAVSRFLPSQYFLDFQRRYLATANSPEAKAA